MSNQMKALAKTAPAPGLDMIEAPVPEIGPDDVLIKVHKTGICGTDTGTIGRRGRFRCHLSRGMNLLARLSSWAAMSPI